MDHHLQFRIDALSQGKPILGKARLDRYPLFRPPSLHPDCARAEAEPQEVFASDASTSSPECASSQWPRNPRQANVQAQVQQLQFWLKVFSRFCQEDDSEQD
jgi:hypothetical protein